MIHLAHNNLFKINLRVCISLRDNIRTRINYL
jgi:hypothetical protein